APSAPKSSRRISSTRRSEARKLRDPSACETSRSAVRRRPVSWQGPEVIEASYVIVGIIVAPDKNVRTPIRPLLYCASQVTALGGEDSVRVRRPALAGLVAAGVAAALGAAAALLLHGTGTGGLLHRAPPATPTPRPLDVTPRRLAGVWVGALGPDALVVTITPRDGREDRGEGAL